MRPRRWVMGERVRCSFDSPVEGDSILARVVSIDESAGLLKILVAAAATEATAPCSTRWVWTSSCVRDLRSALRASSPAARSKRRSIRFRPGPPDERFFAKNDSSVRTRCARGVKKRTKKQRKREQREARKAAVEATKREKRAKKAARRKARNAAQRSGEHVRDDTSSAASDSGISSAEDRHDRAVESLPAPPPHVNITALSPMIRGGRPALDVEAEMPDLALAADSVEAVKVPLVAPSENEPAAGAEEEGEGGEGIAQDGAAPKKRRRRQRKKKKKKKKKAAVLPAATTSAADAAVMLRAASVLQSSRAAGIAAADSADGECFATTVTTFHANPSHSLTRSPRTCCVVRLSHGSADGMMSGTFRLAPGKSIDALPYPFPASLCATCIQRDTGWREYLFARFSGQPPASPSASPPASSSASPSALPSINIQPEQLDAMSFPATALDGLFRLARAGVVALGSGAAPGRSSATVAQVQAQAQAPAPAPAPVPDVARLTLVVVGASAKAEERLLTQSVYWAEIGRHLPGAHIHLELVGLEIAPRVEAHAEAAPKQKQKQKKAKAKAKAKGKGKGASSAAAPVEGAPNMTSAVFKGTLREWMAREAPTHIAGGRQLVVIGYNTGLGGGALKGMASWLPDLIALVKVSAN